MRKIVFYLVVIIGLLVSGYDKEYDNSEYKNSRTTGEVEEPYCVEEDFPENR